MIRRFAAVAVVLTCVVASPASALAGGHGSIRQFGPGAPGIGDPYFPFDGNGGYDVKHYDLDLAYDPATDVLKGAATIRARATQNLSSFNLDLNGLTVRSITVDGRRATWTRADDELTVTPKQGLRKHRHFTTVVATTASRSRSGTLSSASPASSPPTTARSSPASRRWPTRGTRSTTTRSTRPPTRSTSRSRTAWRRCPTVSSRAVAAAHGSTTWVWDAKEPMASYLTTATIGEFDLTAYRKDGIRYWDAIDPDLFTPISPRTGDAVRALAAGELRRYKRLAHTISVPAGGSQLSFWVTRDTELDWDFMFVEAHTVGLRRLDDAARRQRPHERRHRQLVPGRLAGDPPVPRALPDRRGRRHLQPDRHHRRAGGRRHRRERRLRAVGGRPLALRGPGRRGLDQLCQRRRRPAHRRLRRRRRGLDAARLDLVRGRRRHARRLDGARPARGQPRQRERLDRRHRRGRAADDRRDRRRLLRARAGDHRVPRRASSGATRSRPPAASSTTSRASASRSRRRRGRSTRRTSSTDPDRTATPSSSTSSRTSGTATAWRSPPGSTSGSTRASRPTPSGCGASTRGSGPRRRSSTTSPRSSPPTTRSGR